MSQIGMPSRIRSHLETQMIGEMISEFRVLRLLGCGNTAVTYEVVDKNQARWALKLVRPESYGDRAPIREVARFAGTEDDRFLVFPKEIGEWDLRLNRTTSAFIWSRAVALMAAPSSTS